MRRLWLSELSCDPGSGKPFLRDPHSHTTASDRQYISAEAVELVKERGLSILAVTRP